MQQCSTDLSARKNQRNQVLSNAESILALISQAGGRTLERKEVRTNIELAQNTYQVIS